MKVNELIKILQRAKPDAEITATVNLSNNPSDNEEEDIEWLSVDVFHEDCIEEYDFVELFIYKTK